MSLSEFAVERHGRRMVDGIRERLDRVRERIGAAAARSGRPASAVTLVAVSKTVPVETVREALAAGVRILGENRVQEARDKIGALPGAAEWHLIGHLQTNKAKIAAGLFERVHSLDSIRLARELDRHAEEAGRKLRCLIQVNVGGEAQKNGVSETEIRPLLEVTQSLRHLVAEGLMAVPPFLLDPEAVRPFFCRLRGLRDKLAAEGWCLPDLSMGMTHDFEVAIEEGATLVRIGTAIFGARDG
jgi:pyridoxal phosphate enzyme (YggS family)